MNPQFRKKIPMIILFCIMLGIVFYLITNNSGFGDITVSNSGKNSGYNSASSWTKNWPATTTFDTFVFPDPSNTSTNTGYGNTIPVAATTGPATVYTPSGIYTTSYDAVPAANQNTSYLLDDYPSINSTYISGTGGGEFGLFNYIIKTDQRIRGYLSNDAQIIPLQITGTTGTYQSNMIAILTLRNGASFAPILATYNIGYYKPTNTGLDTTFSTLFNIGTGNTTQPNVPAISFNQALLIPSDMNAINKNGTGTPGFNGASRGSATVGNMQKIRLQCILGVLTGMHLLLNGSPATIASGGSGAFPTTLPDYPSGTPAAPTSNAPGPGGWSIAYDLANIYNPNVNTSGTYKPYYWTRDLSNAALTTPLPPAWSGSYVPTPYVLHALYLTLNARNSWVNKIVSSSINITSI